MIDVSEIVGDPDFASEITVTRLGVGTRSRDGVFSPGASDTNTWQATVQPASQDDKDNYLPEGERQSNAIKIWSNREIRMANGKDELADVLVWNNDHYRVGYCKPWQLHGYYFVVAVGYVP